MKEVVVFFMVCCVIINAQQKCAYHYDHLLKLTPKSEGPNTTFMVLDFFSHQRTPGKGFGFSNTNNHTSNSTLTFATLTEIFEFSTFSGIVNNVTCQKKTLDNSFFIKLDGIIHYTCQIDSKIFDNFKFVIFIDNKYGEKNNQESLPMSFVEFHMINHLKPCISDSLSGRGRFDGVYWQLGAISIIFYLVVFFTLVYYRDEQPLKSRRLVPFFALISNFLFLIVDLGINSVSHEWRSQNDCYVDTFVISRFTVIISFLPFFVLL